MIRARIYYDSLNGEVEIKEFENYKEMLEWMKNRHYRWVIEFVNREADLSFCDVELIEYTSNIE